MVFTLSVILAARHGFEGISPLDVAMPPSPGHLEIKSDRLYRKYFNSDQNSLGFRKNRTSILLYIRGDVNTVTVEGGDDVCRIQWCTLKTLFRRTASGTFVNIVLNRLHERAPQVRYLTAHGGGTVWLKHIFTYDNYAFFTNYSVKDHFPPPGPTIPTPKLHWNALGPLARLPKMNRRLYPSAFWEERRADDSGQQFVVIANR